MGERPIVYCLQSHNESVCHLLFDDRHSLCALHAEVHALFRNMELVFHLSSKNIPVDANLFFYIVLNCKHHLSVSRNGIVHLAAVETCEAYAFLLFLHFHIEETSQNLNGVGAFLVNIVARMTTV